MKPFKSILSYIHLFGGAAVAAAAVMLARPAAAQLIAYDQAGYYQFGATANLNWTNGANQGFGFTPWTIVTNGPNYHGAFIVTANNPTFVIATNVLGTNCVWGTFANGTNGLNQTIAFRGFTNSLGTNTFKLQWGSTGAGNQSIAGYGTVHGWSGFSLRTGNDTTQPYDHADNSYDSTAMFYLYFLDGISPSTLYVWDGNSVWSVPNTSFSNLGRTNITNAIEAEVTPAADGQHYHLVLKDCVQNAVLFVTNSIFIGSGTVDSAALFCDDTTGDQIYNRMQIGASTNIAPTFANILPANGSLYISSGATNLSFEVDSFNSTVASSTVKVYLNGVLQAGTTFNTTSPTDQLLGTNSATLAPDTFYNYTIVAQDANGNVVSNIFTFNTFLASDLYIDAYDYNYTNGLYVNSSTPTHAYQNFLGSNGVDYAISDLTGTNNTAGYRPGDLPQAVSLNTDATGDPIDHANEVANYGSIFNIGFTDVGNWENYTRVIPVATNYSIYARAASSSGGQFEIEELVNAAATTTNQPLAALGRVNVPNTGGSKVYAGQLAPLTDFYGNPVVVPLAGTKTLRCTAISSRGYNLEYLAVVATPTTGTLRPYLATGSPSPNATGVSLTSQIAFTIANRQTSANTNGLQLILNSTNVSSRLVMSSNAVGATVTWTPTNNLPVNFTNNVVVIFTDSSGTNVTNSWSFVTGTSGGSLGSGIWSGGGGTNDLLWADAINWTNGTPGPGFSATFASLGATTNLVTNNVVSTNVTIAMLCYATNNSGYHTTWIQDGVTLTVTNGSTANGTEAFQIGGYASNGTTTDNVFNRQVTNTVTGANGTLLILGNSQSSGLANALNFQVRQCAAVAAPEQTVLDMSGLGNFVATVGKFTVGQGGSGTAQSNCTARVSLARTNIITLLRNTSGQFAVGDSSGGLFTLPGNTLNLGLTNALYFDSMNVGSKKATNALVRFNPAFTNLNPAVYIRDTNGPSSRVSLWTIGNVNGETTVPVFNSGTVDLSGGTVDALVGTMTIGAGSTLASDTGYALGALTFSGGTLNVNNLQIGVQKANNTATETGIVNVNGTATLVSTNITLAQTNVGAIATLVAGTLNVTNGTVNGGIVAGGGVSTVNVNGGTLIVSSNSVGTPAAPLTALNLTHASLHLTLNTNTAANVTNIVAATVTVAGGGVSQIVIDAVNGPGAYTLINYIGTDPGLGNLSLAALPAGYTSAGLTDNGTGTISLVVSAGPGSFTNRPGITGFSLHGANVMINGTNGQAGYPYYLLASTNAALPLTQWKVVATNVVGANGNFTFTGTNAVIPGYPQQFYILSNTNSNH